MEMYNEKYKNGIYKKDIFGDDVRVGECVLYLEDGTMVDNLFYKKEPLNGEYYFYTMEGTVWQITNYVNSIPNGIYRRYHDNGSINEYSHLVNDKHHGISLLYLPDGKLITYNIYHDGILMESKAYVDGKWMEVDDSY